MKKSRPQMRCKTRTRPTSTKSGGSDVTLAGWVYCSDKLFNYQYIRLLVIETAENFNHNVFYDLDLNKYNEYFDILYLEGDILHYFNDISEFMKMLYAITKKGGKLILSDFHPFRKITSVGQSGKSASSTKGNYFDSKVYNGDLAYKSEFSKEEQEGFPDCSLRFYTLNEIINAVINVGFTLKEFNEHPNWDDEKIPGEFTIFAIKQDEA